MQIERRKISVDHEKNISIGTIMSDDFMKEMYPILSETYHLFKAPHIRTLLSWTIEYYKEFGTTPKQTISDLFTAKAETIQKDEDVLMIEELLIDISEKYEQAEEYNAEYNIKKAIEYAKKISLLNFSSEVRGLTESGDIKKAEYIAGEYKRVEHAISNGMDLNSEEACERRRLIYSGENNLSVIKFPGAFGQIWGKLEKGGLYLLCSNSKFGKSFLAIDVGKYCQMQGLNVHYYSLEMNSDKLIERYDMNLSKSLVFVNEDDTIDEDYFQSRAERSRMINVPYFTEDNSLDYYQTQASPVNAEKAIRANRLFKKQYRKGNFYVYDSTTSGTTLAEIIRNEDMEEQYNNNVASVVIIDSIYNCSDNMGTEKRHRWDELHWKAKQQLGELRGRVVITPFQMNRAALTSNSADESNLSEAYSVFHHASSALFLRATKEELHKGILRVAANGRDNSYGSGSEVVLTRNLNLARGWIDSRWRKDIPNYDEFVRGEPTVTEADEEELSELTNLDEV